MDEEKKKYLEKRHKMPFILGVIIMIMFVIAFFIDVLFELNWFDKNLFFK